MATMQCEKTEFSFEEQTALDECFKEAECQYAEQPEDTKAKALAAVAGALKNQTKGVLTLMDQVTWSGSFIKNPPKTINSIGAFLQSTIFGSGVAGGVVYAGENKAGDACAWLVSWSNVSNVRRVYVDCGPKDNFVGLKWNDIKSKLDNSPWNGKHTDSSTKTTIVAALVGTSSTGALGAAFLG